MAEDPKILLIVDDDEDWLFLFKRLLNDHGYAVVTAQNCARAINLITHGAPHCVIVDRHLGKEDGSSICYVMKRTPKFKGIPIILLSGDSDTGEKCDYAACVCKADGIDRILSVIKQVLSKK